MYSFRYVNEDGTEMLLDYDRQILITSVDGLTSNKVDIGTSQGFSQVGETVMTQSVSSKDIRLQGMLIGDNLMLQRNQLLKTITPTKKARLYIDDKYYVECVPKTTPIISDKLKDPIFEFVVTAPYPYWKKSEESTYQLGNIIKMFRMRLQSDTVFAFGKKSDDKFKNCFNGGSVETDYAFEFSNNSLANIPNFGIINVSTFEYIKLFMTLKPQEKVYVWREYGQLRAVLLSGDVRTNVLYKIDEDSTLFNAHVGDNILTPQADSNADNLYVSVTLNNTFVGVYDGM